MKHNGLYDRSLQLFKDGADEAMIIDNEHLQI